MKRPGIFSLRYRLMLLVLLAVVPALVLILVTASEHRRTAANEVQQNALRVARMTSAGQERLIEGAHQLLVVLAQLPELRGNNPASAAAVLARLLKQYSSYNNFGVIEMDGSVFASAQKLPPDVNLKDRSYFKRAVETVNFAMGDYQMGRITKMPSVNFAYPIINDEGKVWRVVFAALDLDWIEKAAAQAELPRGTTLMVMDSEGTVLVGWPNPDQWRGQTIKNDALLPLIRTHHEGTTQMKGADGAQRLYAFVHLRGATGTGFVSVSIGIPKQVAYAEANRILKRNLLWFGVVALLAAAAAWIGGEFFVLKRVRMLVDATKRLETGDLGTRTGMSYGSGELGQLAHAFDQMAVSLQQRSNEREEAEKQLKTLNEQLEQRVLERTLQVREKNRQFESDLELAREFQVGLLPNHYPEFFLEPGRARPSVQFAHYYEPSGSVGGDFFDILKISETEAGIFLCDVMGHGVRAALVTAIVRGLIEELKPVAHDPANFIKGMNGVLVDVLKGMENPMFTTALYMVVDVERRKLVYTSAGHPRPIRLRKAEGAVEPLHFEGTALGPVLGLFKAAIYTSSTCDLDPGDAVLAYTDGLSEVTNPAGEEFGDRRLINSARSAVHLPLEEVFKEIVTAAKTFSANGGFEDDVCLVGFELERPDSAPSLGAG